ncbi:MAG: hypothetical protein J1F35_02255 [Erysipelotrichales bacterium]|nr:hypothetical protein [Erysipelotrichales bacterium]
MNNNETQNNNYVTPEQVDLSKVNVVKQDTTLNRERDNIVSASIQANSAINEESAKTVNNTIKVKKKNPVISLIIGLFFIAIAGGLSYVGYRLLDDYIKKDDARHTTTTTTTQEVNRFHEYLVNYSKLRKFQNSNTILILLPTIYPKTQKYMLFNTSEEGILYQEEGTYNIVNNVLGLTSSEDGYRTFVITEINLIADGISLDTFDQEVKYYAQTQEEIERILVINGTTNNEVAYYCDLGVCSIHKYTEDAEAITLDNGITFAKNENNIINNDIIYSYIN